MREMKKIISCLSVAVAMMIAVCAMAMPSRPEIPSEGATCVMSGTRGESRDINICYEPSAIPARNPSAWGGDSEDEIKAPRENASGLDRVMNKDASTALRSELRAAWKTYVNEHCRSITEGGKNSIPSSANLFKNWRDALRSALYA